VDNAVEAARKGWPEKMAIARLPQGDALEHLAGNP
jgi:hypothetical protein